MTTSKIVLFLTLCAAISATTTSTTFAAPPSETQDEGSALDPQSKEVPVYGVFAPKFGFDDNDDVQVVIDGYLPNSCYQKGKTKVLVNPTTKTIVITQYAKLEESDLCNDQENLPPEMKVPLKFMSEADIGELTLGDYRIQYNSLEGPKERSLNIEAAQNRNNIDNVFYAITSNAYVKEVVDASQPHFSVSLTGYLNSPCVSLSNKMKGVLVNDVIILLPEIVKNGGVCPPVTQDFSLDLSLKTPPPGRYLLHIRSLNGTAVNRLFTVK